MRTALGLVVLLVSQIAFAAPQFLYFAPGNNISPDGQFVLAAFRDDPTNDMGSYRVVTVSGTGIEIASDMVFEAYSDHPDIRGYGPGKTSWSERQPENGARIYGELVGFQYLSRKSTQIDFLQRKLVDGKAYFTRTAFDASKLEKIGKAKLVEEAAKAGYVSNDIQWEFSNQEFVTEGDTQGTYVTDGWPEVFDLEGGRLIEISEQFYIHKGDDDSTATEGTYSVIAKISLDANGALKEEVVSTRANLSK